MGLDEEVLNAKQFLSTSSDGKSVCDKVSDLLSIVLDERPAHPVDNIDFYIKNERSVEDKQDIQQQVIFAETQIKLFDKNIDDDLLDEELLLENEDEFDMPFPNCEQLNFYFEQVSVGLGREEMYRIFLAIKQLVLRNPLSSIRLWGKIFGLESNYIIAEAEYKEGEGDDEEENLEKIKRLLKMLKNSERTKHPCPKRCVHCGLRKRMRSNTVSSAGNVAGEEEEPPQDTQNEDDDDGPAEEDILAQNTWTAPVPIPKEEHRVGTNKKVYFVCNEPGGPWSKLPHVTPAEINGARSITKLLTGRLDAEVKSYPPFPGNEANYLRAQIARISASTQISPAGYFIFDDEEEEDEDEVFESYTVNEDFDGVPLKDLTHASMFGWVHHASHILPQGRCTWHNPNEKLEDDFEEEEYDEEDEENSNGVVPETGPTLLASVAHDKPIGVDMSAWSTYLSSRVLPEYAVAVARSNRWPGAYAFAKSEIFENIYIGWGNKYTPTCFNPTIPPPAQTEFVGEDVLEMNDPTVEEEMELKQRQEEAERAARGSYNSDEDEEDQDDDD